MLQHTKNLEYLDYLRILAALLTIATLLTSVLYYREMASKRLVTFWSWLLQSIYSLNPYLLWQSDDFWKRCVLWYCAIRARFSVNEAEREKLLDWANSKIRGVSPPVNFTTSWRDGIALCALMEDLSSGSCPRFDLLNPEHCQSNVHLALKMAQRHLKMKPSISVKEMVECLPSGEKKLISLISQLKMTENWKPRKSLAINDPGLPLIRLPGSGERSFGLGQECVAKGMGLMLAVKGRKATFNIFLKTSTNLNIVIEIKGPNNSIASERITSRSPKRKTPIKQGTPVLEASTLFRSGDIRRSISMSSDNEQDGEGGPIKIPFEYEVQQGKISVGYIPKETGKHRLSIINEGQHIMGSPYTITVDDSYEASAETKSKINKRLLTPFNKGDSFEMDSPPNIPTTDTLKPSFVIQGSPFMRGSLTSSSKKLGMVTKRRVLRHILTIDGREVVVEDADAEHLGMAVQALKEVEDCDRFDFHQDQTATENKVSRQNSVDEFDRDPEIVHRHVLCPVHEDTDLKDVRSPSPKVEVDCGPIFNDRPRAMSYTESEISSIDGIDTGGVQNHDAFKWNVLAEVPDRNHNFDSVTSKNNDTIPRFEITRVTGDGSDKEREIGNVTPVPVSFLDTSNDETDSITPEFAHINEMTSDNGIRDNYEETHFQQNDFLRQSGSSIGGSESDEWLVISMDVKTKLHSLKISDEEVQSPFEEIQGQVEIKASTPNEDIQCLNELVGSLPVEETQRPNELVGSLPVEETQRPNELVGSLPVEETQRPNELVGSLPVEETQRPNELVGSLPVEETQRPNELVGSFPVEETQRQDKLDSLPVEETQGQHEQEFSLEVEQIQCDDELENTLLVEESRSQVKVEDSSTVEETQSQHEQEYSLKVEKIQRDDELENTLLVEDSRSQVKVEDSLAVEETFVSSEAEEFESDYKQEEYHSMEEYQSSPEMDNPQILKTEGTAEAVLETVTDRKQFFENLFIQTNSKSSSPVHSPIKRGALSPQAGSTIRPIATSYSVDESLTSQIKKKFPLESVFTPKSHSLCSLSDTVDTSPNFQKTKNFWERGNVMSQTTKVSRERIPEVSSNKHSPIEEEVGMSIRQKLDFWQTLTTSSKPTSPDHETPARGDRGIRKTDIDGSVDENPATDLIVKDSRDSLLESPGSEDTRDSGVFISWSKLNTPAPDADKFRSLGKTFSDPGASEAKNSAFVESSNTLPLPNSFIFRQNPLFSLDTDSALDRYNDFESATEESNGLNETMSDDRGYIDDEIPDYASLTMDRYVSFTGLLDNDRLLSRNELIGLGIEETLSNYYGESQSKDSEKSFLLPQPGKCRAFGAGVYYGQVGVRNQFQVCTSGGGKGYLTVSVQGPGEHDVKEVVVSYAGEYCYEVMYEVLEPGYYIISVKWSEWNIPESPFICKVTY